ncbi:MAG: hypothetical protein IJ705_00945 [Oscillospiraceae bacterium]|nr:hypothetical protein [Oscillospiraceae bacterium]
MSDFHDALADLEIGLSDLTCAQGAYSMIQHMLEETDDEVERAKFVDMLHIVNSFLETVIANLDAVSSKVRRMSAKMA